MTGSSAAVAAALREKQSFIITSHARPDGDAIGSSLALALALDRLNKRVRIVMHDPAPTPYRSFPGIDRIEITDHVTGPADAAVLMECSDISRPDVAGLDQYYVINVDHHLGNAMYGAVNWFDPDAAACGELVADIVDALGVDWSHEIAAHLFLAISTDTGGFRYGPITARTFEACRRIAATGIDTPELSREIFDSFSIGRVKLTGALLNTMELHHANQLAMLAFDDALLAECGASIDDTEGLVNLPLGAREVVAVALFKRQDAQTFRVSLRSKGAVNVQSVAAQWKGGGHKNAAGCAATGELTALKKVFAAAMAQAIDAASASRT